MKLSAEQMRTLPDFLKPFPTPRRRQGQRHRLATVLAIAAGAVLYKDSDYVDYGTCEHGSIENSCHYIIDWNYDEDRSRIRTGHRPENMTRLRRFAIGIIKSRGARNVAQKMRKLALNPRTIFDYFRMTQNSCGSAATN